MLKMDFKSEIVDIGKPSKNNLYFVSRLALVSFITTKSDFAIWLQTYAISTFIQLLLC